VLPPQIKQDDYTPDANNQIEVYQPDKLNSYL